MNDGPDHPHASHGTNGSGLPLLKRFEALAAGNPGAHKLFNVPWRTTDTIARVEDAAGYLRRAHWPVEDVEALLTQGFPKGIGSEIAVPIPKVVREFYALADRIDAAKAAKRGDTYGRLLVLRMDDIDTAKARSYLLKGLISPGEISIWVGPPKCGKSFLLLYVTYMLSLGRSVFGRRVKPTVALYVAAEGESGIANRLRALLGRYGKSKNFHWIAQPADLLRDGGHKDDLIAAAKAVGAQLIVLDTLSRLMAGGDENSSVDMGQFVANVTDVRLHTGAHSPVCPGMSRCPVPV